MSFKPGWSDFAVVGAVWSLLIAYALLVFWFNPPTDDPLDWISILTEGGLALASALGLFLVVGLKPMPAIQRPLQIGLILLSLALVTDTLDEFVSMPELFNHLFEGVFQILGFVGILVAMRRWIGHNEQLQARLQRLAMSDDLTGLDKRRHFLALLHAAIARAQRYSQHLTVVLFDIDHFKHINDTHGHDVGDLVLVAVAERGRACLREIDVFARYGGEEFVVLASHTDLDGACRLAEKLCAAIRELTPHPAGKITASFGVSAYRRGESVDTLLKRADVALYEAKAAGRDRVCAGG